MKKGSKRPRNAPLFENEEYSITEIPLNYAIDVKIMVDGNKTHPRMKLVPDQFYAPLGWGLEFAHEQAKATISKFRERATNGTE